MARYLVFAYDANGKLLNGGTFDKRHDAKDEAKRRDALENEAEREYGQESKVYWTVTKLRD